MLIQKVTVCSAAEKKQINDLIACCREKEGLRLSMPLEELSSLYLLWETEPARTLSSVFGFIIPEDDDFDEPAECFAFTHPDKRGRGCFSALLEAAEEDLEDYELLFAAAPDCRDAICTLDSLGAEHVSTEYLMELDLASCRSNPPSCRRLTISETQEEEAVFRYDFYQKEGQRTEKQGLSKAAGFCRIRISEDRACFYDFEIEESLRGCRLGTEAFSLTASLLRQKGLKGLYLHVSANNHPAVALYKKTGFRISETLSYYLY